MVLVSYPVCPAPTRVCECLCLTDFARSVLFFSFFLLLSVPGESSGFLLICSYGGGLHFIPYVHRTQNKEQEIQECCSIELKPTINFNEYETGHSTTSVIFDVSPGKLSSLFTVALPKSFHKISHSF